MKGPYQIKRDQDCESLRVCWELVDIRTGDVVRSAWTTGKHIFPPSDLRLLQATLNTAAALD